MAESQRVLSGSYTKGSAAHVIYPTEYSGSNATDRYRQGIECVLIDHAYRYIGLKIQPINDFLKIKHGKIAQPNVIFDDTESPTSVAVPVDGLKQDYKAIITFNDSNTASGLKIAINHAHDQRDLGMAIAFQDGAPYDDVVTNNPIDIISYEDNSESNVDSFFESDEDIINDGLIEAYAIRKLINITPNEYPRAFKGLSADLQISDTSGNSFIIENEIEKNNIRTVSTTNIDHGGINRRQYYIRGVTFYFDDIRLFGEENLVEPISIMGSTKPEYMTITPYIDSSDDEDRINMISDDIDDLMTEAILQSNATNNDFFYRNHISSVSGYVYNNTEFVTDSLAYGGLIK